MRFADPAMRTTRPWVRRCLAACGASVVLAAVLAACGGAPVGGIGVTGGAVETHKSVTAGDTVRITARGTLDFGGGFAGIGATRLSADGGDDATPPDSPAPHLRRNSLVARIGEAYYQGGVDTTFVAATTGEVVLLVNDPTPPTASSGWDVQVAVGAEATTNDRATGDDGGPAAFSELPVGGPPIRTEVYVDAGSTVRLTSAGVLDVGRTTGDDASPRVNADGDDGPAAPGSPAPNLRPNSLIVQIDGDPAWYQGGSDTTFVPTTSGRLVLAVNDDDVHDNTQSWFVAGRVASPPTTPAVPVAFGPFVVSNTTIETGLVVESGRTVHVEARGLVNLGGEGGDGRADIIDGADGDGPDSPTPRDYPAPELRLNSLLVKVGDTYLQGGRSVDVVVRRGGPVSLLANDVLPEDNRSVVNSGVRGWSVTLTLR